jgi:uncharacterized membrane protein
MPPEPFEYPNPLAHVLADGLTSLFVLALLGVLAWAVIELVNRRHAGATTPPPNAPSAIELLRQRYALGEIDTATFEQMLERLLASGVYERSRGMPPYPHL